MKTTLFFFFLTISLTAQVKGVVKDSISGKPIPFAGVFTSKEYNNFTTDSKGKIDLKNLSKNDTIWIFTTGYETKRILIKEFSKNIYLNPIIKKEKHQDIEFNKNEILVDTFENQDSIFNNSASTYSKLLAFHIENNLSNDRSIIDKVYIETTNLTNKKNIFKIRFFESDSLKNITKEYQINPIIINLKTPKEDRNTNVMQNSILINEINLGSEKIEICQNGFFIGIEILNLKENKKELILDSLYKVFSPIFRNSKQKTLIYEYSEGKWKKHKSFLMPTIKITALTTQN